MDNLSTKLYRTSKTVFTNKDLALIWQENSRDNLKSKISYYVKRGILVRLTRGVFSKSEKYNIKELANSIYSPSYISFETVLREAGVIFQHYDTIFLASKWPKVVTINKSTFTFRKLKDMVLFNNLGVINKDNCSIATPERAFLDTIYLFPDYYFDNLEPIDWRKCEEIVKIYNNKKLIKRLNKYKKEYAQ